MNLDFFHNEVSTIEEGQENHFEETREEASEESQPIENIQQDEGFF